MDGTSHNGSSGWMGAYVGSETLGTTSNRNQDISYGSSTGFFHTNSNIMIWNRDSAYINRPTSYTSRPTNTSVLYCIKY